MSMSTLTDPARTLSSERRSELTFETNLAPEPTLEPEVLSSYADQVMMLDTYPEVAPWFFATGTPVSKMDLAMGIFKQLRKAKPGKPPGAAVGLNITDSNCRVVIIGEKKVPWLGVFLSYMSPWQVYSILPRHNVQWPANWPKPNRFSLVGMEDTPANLSENLFTLRLIFKTDSPVLLINLDCNWGKDFTGNSPNIFRLLPDNKTGVLQVTSAFRSSKLFERFKLDAPAGQRELYPYVGAGGDLIAAHTLNQKVTRDKAEPRCYVVPPESASVDRFSETITTQILRPTSLGADYNMSNPKRCFAFYKNYVKRNPIRANNAKL